MIYHVLSLILVLACFFQTTVLLKECNVRSEIEAQYYVLPWYVLKWEGSHLTYPQVLFLTQLPQVSFPKEAPPPAPHTHTISCLSESSSRFLFPRSPYNYANKPITSSSRNQGAYTTFSILWNLPPTVSDGSLCSSLF